VDLLSSEQRSWNMSRIRSKNTLPELKVRSALHKLGFRFRLHYNKLPGKPDIALPRFKTVVFVHGCFWHRHPKCKYSYSPKSRIEFWRKKFQDTVARDRRQYIELSTKGWNVITVWECETFDPLYLVEILLKKIDKVKETTVKSVAKRARAAAETT
jgi:DNA mismatch endonuclease, patch repair protein